MPQIESPSLSFNSDSGVITVTDTTVYGGGNYVRSEYGLILVYESVSNDNISTQTIIDGNILTVSSWTVNINDGVHGFTVVAINYEATKPSFEAGYNSGDYIIAGDDNKIYQLIGSEWFEADIPYSTYDSTLKGSSYYLNTLGVELSLEGRFLDKAQRGCFDEKKFLDQAFLNCINHSYYNNDFKHVNDLIEDYTNYINNN